MEVSIKLDCMKQKYELLQRAVGLIWLMGVFDTHLSIARPWR